jgi:hypothetical protein
MYYKPSKDDHDHTTDLLVQILRATGMREVVQKSDTERRAAGPEAGQV